MPIVEAQACGVPVITSNISSMPEVLGESGILVDPFNVESICGAMESLDENVSLCDVLVLKGHENLKRFNWQETADTIFNLITK